MQRLIDANALKKHLHKDPLYPLVKKYGMDGVIDAQLTIDAEPVRHGKWIYKKDGCINCSECGADMPYKYYYGYTDWISNYCPNCGAKMEIPEENE